ncbi:separin protein, partial [Coemansia sp. RSA 2399]
IDGAKNITVVREAVDVLRRRGEFIPAQLTLWPSDIIVGSKNNAPSSSGANCGSNEMLDSSPVRFRGNSRKLPSLDRPPPLLGVLDQQSTSGDSSSTTDYDIFKRAVDGKMASSSWTSSDAIIPENADDLGKLLPPSWVVCGISVDPKSNMLLITRYENKREPTAACLPMREIELNLEDMDVCANGMANPESVFDSVYRNIAAIIDASDKSMKTGKDCNTEAEKRSWWEKRASLDRNLGTILHSIQSEWLGGFHFLLDPKDIFGLISGSGDLDSIVAALRKDIQTCIHGSLPKSFAAKAKVIELADQLCVLVLYAALSENNSDSSGSENSSEWLDVCAMLWDVYSYQGAAPLCTDDSLNTFAAELRLIMS